MQTSKRFRGNTCPKHPELKGERQKSSGRCVACNREKVSEWRRKNRNKALDYAKVSSKKCKQEVFEHYGGNHCSLCGFDHPDALSLDHVDGGGGRMRKDGEHPWGGYALYVWLKNNGYPEHLKFRVLCFNCNAIGSVRRLRKERREVTRGH